MKRKVCFLVTEHSFLDVRIFQKESKSLQKKGYEITMIVPRINGRLSDIDGTKFNDIFTSQTFYHEGIKIVAYDERLSNQKVDEYLENLRSGNHYGFTDELSKLGIKEKADVYHAHEFLSFYSGIGIKRALEAEGKPVKLIYDSHELYPDPLSPINKKFKKEESMLISMLKEVDAVLTVSESIKNFYLKLHSPLFIEVVYNSPPLTLEYEHKSYDDSEAITIVHEGFISKDRGNWKKLLAIVENLRKTEDIQLKILGGNRANEKKLIVPPRLNGNIEIKNWIDYTKIPKEMKNAHIGWIDLNLSSSLNNQYAMPNKFFSYLNNGIPVIVNNCIEMRNFLEKYKCGICIPKEHVSGREYAEKISSLMQNKNLLKEMSLNARKVMEEKYCWENMEKRLLSIYESILET